MPLYSLIYIILIILCLFQHLEPGNRPLCIAHRGASGIAPENTMAAFDLALQLRADFIEFDVQLSRDNQLVVIHDTRLDRTTNGSGLVRAFTLEELKLLDAGGWFNKRYQTEKIPTLKEVFTRYKGLMNFLIEIKDPQLHPGIEKILADEIVGFQKWNQGTDIIVQSFNLKSLRKFHDILPNIPVGLLTSFPPSEKVLQHLSFCDYINIHHTRVNESILKSLEENGKKSFVWTVNSKESWEKVHELSVEGFITDYPNILLPSNHLPFDEYLEKLGDILEFLFISST